MIPILEDKPWWNKLNRFNAVNKQSSFNKMLLDKNIYKIKIIDNYYFIYYRDGSIFKCKGLLVENSNISEFNKPNKKQLF